MHGSIYLIVGVFAAAVASQACRLGELTFSAVTVPSLINNTRHTADDHTTATVTAYSKFVYSKLATPRGKFFLQSITTVFL